MTEKGSAMKIMVSACLLGQECKYDGGDNLNERVLAFTERHEVISVCPEVAGGLPVPRPSCEICNGTVCNINGENKDREFREGAEKCLKLAKEKEIDMAILQSRSPSCGVGRIYDGTFSGKLINGSGVFASLLLENGFRVLDAADVKLFELQDVKYGEFQAKLLPTVDPDTIIGVRTPALRALAKTMAKEPDVNRFLDALPHRWFDENQLHAFILSGMKDYDGCIGQVERFLPFIDNWATCDQLSPKVFKKNKEDLLRHAREWIRSGRTYTIRFGIGMLMEHFLDADFDPEYPEMVAAVESDEYYVNMMRAWYFATALAKQYDTEVPYIEEQRLDRWTHNKTIQKAVESYRITPEQKEYLRSLRAGKETTTTNGRPS